MVLVLMGSSFLSEVHDASDQEGALHPITSFLLIPALPQVTLPRSGYRGSDLVRWHRADDFGAAAKLSAVGGIADPFSGAVSRLLLTHFYPQPRRPGCDAASAFSGG